MHSKVVLVLVAMVAVAHAIEKPDFDVVKQVNDKVQIRKYAPSKWVATTDVTKSCMKMDDLKSGMFMNLFRYIGGDNSQQKKIEMTAPVVSDLKNTAAGKLIDSSSECAMSMRFFVPKENQADTPAPKSGAELKQVGEKTVAVIKFGWYPKMSDYMDARDDLIAALGDEASQYDQVNVKLAGYDSPWKFWDRTNEVWMYKL